MANDEQQIQPLDSSDGSGRGVVRGPLRWLYGLLAGLFFLLGTAGAILPGLPATPFLLLTSCFLVRINPKLNDRLLRSRFLGPILVDWQQHGGVRRHVKIKSVICVALIVGLSLCLGNWEGTARLGLIFLAAIGMTVIWRLPVAET